MATALSGKMSPTPHTAGLFADMSLDGPEIGTLVLVIDRAKNLPNRKTMGKQNPYCAIRLGKEAKKTETDHRGGQTPRWDQELRFTVHDSLDFHSLKISIFSEDKRTDLIGEAWISLKEVVVPGGGKNDLWQGLTCKGKYAGELRIELTYYDSRPRPELPVEALAGEELKQSVGSGSSRVKRRPLPSNPTTGSITPDMISGRPIPGRAKHGPRDFNTPSRANSMPVETTIPLQPTLPILAPTPVHGQPQISSPVEPQYQTPQNHYQEGYEQYQEPLDYEPERYDQPYHETPDFLPQLPPSNRQRGPILHQPRMNTRQSQPQPPHPRPFSHAGLIHTHSAPAVPTTQDDAQGYDDSFQLHTDYPEPIPDLEFQHQQLRTRPRRSDTSPAWQNNYHEEFVENEYYEDDRPAPPPPPMHSNSAPSVPQYNSHHGTPTSSPMPMYGGTPPQSRYHSVPNSSPLQHIERKYISPQHTPPGAPHQRGMSVDSYSPSPRDPRAYDSSPTNYLPGQSSSPYARQQPPPQHLPHRHSVAEPYYSTPPRPHPLSQEVPRPRSPQPHHPQELPDFASQSHGNSPYQQDYRGRDIAPMIKPRAISPRPPQSTSQPNSAPRPRSSYNIQFPVRGFESADNSPLSNSQPNQRMPRPSTRSTPIRKSVSPHPMTPSSAGAIPFSPDSYDVHNPNARATAVTANESSPYSPYQVKPGSEAAPTEPNGPIVNWNGQEIDPSDHLPVNSWAPEPEKKTPTKTYGLGRERDFGPRSATEPGSRSISKDTKINVRIKPHAPLEQEQTNSRNRLQKKAPNNKSPAVEPLRERHNYNSISIPDPYAQQEYSRGFYDQQQDRDTPSNNFAPSPTSYGGPSPTDALSREISNIDIGSGKYSRPQQGGVPQPTAYVPVRSQRERNSFY